jgi:hypothetical protein
MPPQDLRALKRQILAQTLQKQLFQGLQSTLQQCVAFTQKITTR